MTKKQHTACYIIGLIVATIGGISGTAFSMGASKQRIDDMLTKYTVEMVSLKEDDKAHEKAIQKELDRFAEIISSQMNQLQSTITHLTNTVGYLRTDVHVLKAIMERIEKVSLKG